MVRVVSLLWWFESKVMHHKPSWFCSWVWDVTLRYMPRDEYLERIDEW